MTLTKLRICTFNARSLCSQARFAEFQAEVDKIKHDIIGIAEVKRRGSGRLNLPNDAVLLYAGHDNKTADGVGFYVSPHLKSRIAGFNAISPCVAELLLSVDRQDRMLCLIQVYAPTLTHNNTVYDAFLDDGSTLLARSAQLNTATPPNDEAADIYRHIVTNVKAAMQLATTHRPRTLALSVETLDMLQQRRELKRDANVRNSIEFAELCKTIRKAVQHDLQQHHLQLIDEAIRTGTLRRARSGLAKGRRQITTLGRNDGTCAFMTAEIMNIVRSFYKSFYHSSQQNNSSYADDDTSDVENDNAPPFLESEIRQALQKMKSGTSPGYDGITAEALSAGAESLAPILTRLFNNCLDHASIPEGFADAKTILMFKKGDATDIKNYRPISLLNTITKYSLRSSEIASTPSSTLQKQLSKPVFDRTSQPSITYMPLMSSSRRPPNIISLFSWSWLTMRRRSIRSRIQVSGKH
uniref:Uncharacterized protein n=1 Tax=Plectus sambesii TaxID=2011161 RepID=A0A914XSB3_9BILA